jgi:regulator of sigma E protease
MDSAIIAIAAFVPMLVMLVVIHEWGHFFTAKAFNVKVLEFGIGYPPRAYGFYTGKTEVMLHPRTKYLNLNGPADLHPGRFIRLLSTEDGDGNLIALLIEASPADGSKNPISLQQLAEGDLLQHSGKVRQADDQSLVVADMLYSVNWLPLGGFVRLAGENSPDVPRSLAAQGVGPRAIILAAGSLMNAIFPIVAFTLMFMIPQNVTIGQVAVAQGENSPDVPRSLAAQGVGPRAIILAAGSLMNAIFPIVAFTLMFMIPQNVTIGQVAVAQVENNSPAQAAGLRPGDVITHAGGREIEHGSDLVRATMLNAGSEMEWTVEREGRTEIVRLVPRVNPPEGQGATGIQISMVNLYQETRYEPPWTAVAHGFTNTWEILRLLQQEISSWISGTRAPQLSGPVGIAQVTGEVTQQGGLRGWLVLSILFSINLAVLNLLPIPMLDGGRLVFVGLEWVRGGKRVPPEREGLVHLIGFIVLIGFILIITYQDITRLIQGVSPLGG